MSFQNVYVRAPLNRRFPGAHLLVNLGFVLGTKTSKTLVLAWSGLETCQGDRPHILMKILWVICYYCDQESMLNLECTLDSNPGLVTPEL